MEKQCKVTYIKHSGILIETRSSYLLFDYWEGEIPKLNSKKNLYVLSSHAHRDHFTKDIFKLENSCITVEYLLSSDIRTKSSFWKRAENVTFLDPCTEKQIGELRVKTFLSTDEGIAFLVKLDGLNIYHAGDLHWWYWPGDPEEDNEGRRKENYLKEIRKLKDEQIDISFVVLDPRQEYAGGYGMDQFLSRVHSRYVFPIHFWEDYSYIREYKKKNENKYPATCIMEITGKGQTFDVVAV